MMPSLCCQLVFIWSIVPCDSISFSVLPPASVNIWFPHFSCFFSSFFCDNCRLMFFPITFRGTLFTWIARWELTPPCLLLELLLFKSDFKKCFSKALELFNDLTLANTCMLRVLHFKTKRTFWSSLSFFLILTDSSTTTTIYFSVC